MDNAASTSAGTVKFVIGGLIFLASLSIVSIVVFVLHLPKDLSQVLATAVVTGLIGIATTSAGALGAILTVTHSQNQANRLAAAAGTQTTATTMLTTQTTALAEEPKI